MFIVLKCDKLTRIRQGDVFKSQHYATVSQRTIVGRTVICDESTKKILEALHCSLFQIVNNKLRNSEILI